MSGEWKLAIIAGTGASKLVPSSSADRIVVPTRFGPVHLADGRLGGQPVLMLSRHGAGHRVPPHRVDPRAFASALLLLGCDTCVSTAAVGSLRADWPQGTLVLASDILDLSARNLTLYEDTVVHTDCSAPFDPDLRATALAASPPVKLIDGGTYVNANGPRFESPKEVAAMRMLGGDVVGMTAGTEAVIMREAGIRYAVVCAVTNLAAGLAEGELAHGDVYKAMARSMEQIGGVFQRLAAAL